MGVRDILQGRQPKAARRRRGGRQACLALLSGAILFFVLQFAASAALDCWFPGAIDPDYVGRFRNARPGRLVKPEPARTVVMLGSSRTYYGLKAERLDAPLSRQSGQPVSVLNFGFTGAGPMTELLTWRRMRHDSVRPDLVLIEVLPVFLSNTFSVDDTREDRLPADRLRWSDLALLESHGVGRTRPELRRDFLETTALTLYRHRLKILMEVAPRLLYCKGSQKPLVERMAPAPWPPAFTRQDREKARDFARKDYTPFLRDFHIGGRNCEALHELLASCRRAGVPAALVLMPEGPDFRSWYPPETWRQIQEWLEQLAREEGASLINAREWIDEDDFLDSHHLLQRGAEKFTARLGREYIQPVLDRRVANRP